MPKWLRDVHGPVFAPQPFRNTRRPPSLGFLWACLRRPRGLPQASKRLSTGSPPDQKVQASSTDFPPDQKVQRPASQTELKVGYTTPEADADIREELTDARGSRSISMALPVYRPAAAMGQPQMLQPFAAPLAVPYGHTMFTAA